MRALQELKDYLIENILPWLPLAIDFISLGKRKRRFDLLPPAEVATALVPPTTTLDASIQSILNRLYTLAALPSSCTRSTEEHF
eukprot:gene23065-17454_t